VDHEDRRHWIVRLTRLPDRTRRAGADAQIETGWYAGYGGLVRLRVVVDRRDAHRFDEFPDATRTKDNLLRQGVADEAEVEED
jgi:hypothetical protein